MNAALVGLNFVRIEWLVGRCQFAVSCGRC